MFNSFLIGDWAQVCNWLFLVEAVLKIIGYNPIQCVPVSTHLTPVSILCLCLYHLYPSTRQLQIMHVHTRVHTHVHTCRYATDIFNVFDFGVVVLSFLAKILNFKGSYGPSTHPTTHPSTHSLPHTHFKTPFHTPFHTLIHTPIHTYPSTHAHPSTTHTAETHMHAQGHAHNSATHTSDAAYKLLPEHKLNVYT